MRFFYPSYLAWIIIWQLLQKIIAHKRGARRRKAKRSGKPADFAPLMASQLLIAASITFVFVIAPFSIIHEAFVPVQVTIGSAIAIMGLYLTLSAQWYLGPNWTGARDLQTVHVQHQVITSGPYKYIRHPMYSGLLVTAVGLSVGSWNVWYALGCLSFAAAFMVRARPEERALGALPGQRGRDYVAFVQRTGAFSPRISRRRA